MPAAVGGGSSSTVSPKRQSKWLGVIAATAVCCLVLGSLLLAIVRFGGQTMNTLSSSREQTASMRNLEKIAAAMNAYAADHGTYPAAMTVDANGKPLHSWRVTLLPYLGEDDLYNQIDLTLPWDHANNLAVTRYQTPMVYVHPSIGYSYGAQAAYFVITGTGTLFPGNANQPLPPMGPADITDEPTQTLLVVEGVPVTPMQSWSEPVDLPFTMMTGQLAGNPGNEPGGLTEGGVAAVTVDGRGHFIEDTITPKEFLALVTPDGGERLRDDTLD